VEERRTPHRGRLPHQLLHREGSPEACWLTSTNRTAGCGPACPVVWQGISGGVAGDQRTIR
jgi:hypothetical protein